MRGPVYNLHIGKPTQGSYIEKDKTMDINPEQILRSGKHSGKTVGWIMRFDRRYFDWVKENAPGMLKEHNDHNKKPSGWAPGYDPKHKSAKPPEEDYMNWQRRPQTSVPQREWTLEQIHARTFPEIPEGASRYSLLNAPAWGSATGEEMEEGN